MNLHHVSALLQLSLLHCVFCSPLSNSYENDRPIIGVIAVETGPQKWKSLGSSLITASYVKFLEAGGARVVPVRIYQSQEYYEDLLSKINGVLYPGGAELFNSSGYGRTGKIIFDIAVKLNDRKDHFPLWGTCLGFEFFNYVAANNKLWMKACAAEDFSSTLTFLPDFNKSRMFSNLEKTMVDAMSSRNVTINYHQWCLTPQNYTLSGLNKYFQVLSVSQDARNTTYVSSIEAFKYPFYGVAFHPEKVLFEWVSSKTHHNIPHTKEAVQVSQYFANFFVSEARKNQHRFPNKAAEDELLIYNYGPVFTGKRNSTTEQNYFFN